jgi:dethiobiotin synthetase
MVMPGTLAIAGSDTEVGKTMLVLALAAYWQQWRRDRGRLGLFKPVQSGEGDREIYQHLFADLNQAPESFNPIRLAAPLAPPIAAEMEGKSIDLALAWRSLTALQAERDLVIVEGAGGLGSPVTWELTFADVVAAWRLPLLLVVPVKLGAIAQTVANVALARQHNLTLQGIVLNEVRPTSLEERSTLAPADWISQLTGVPVLGYLPHLTDWHDRSALAAAAAQLDLDRLWPIASPVATH